MALGDGGCGLTLVARGPMVRADTVDGQYRRFVVRLLLRQQLGVGRWKLEGAPWEGGASGKWPFGVWFGCGCVEGVVWVGRRERVVYRPSDTDTHH